MYTIDGIDSLKPLYWMGTSKKDLKQFPEHVQQIVGRHLLVAQRGLKPIAAKVLRGFGGAGVLEVVEDFDGNTYRAVYTVKFREAVYVLHCFQKKSVHGIATPRRDIEMIHQRMKLAEDHYRDLGERSDEP